jgi:hypothetical protein
MEHPLYDIIGQYGIYAVFALCTVEGDITLLISGVLAHSGFFGRYSFFWVRSPELSAAWRVTVWLPHRPHLHENARTTVFTKCPPRVEKLIEKFGGSAIIISKCTAVSASPCACFTAWARCRSFVPKSALSCFMGTAARRTGYFFGGAIVDDRRFQRSASLFLSSSWA